MGSNWSKMVQMGSKWSEIGPNEFKWIYIGPQMYSDRFRWYSVEMSEFFLSLIFYVKSVIGNLEVVKLPFFAI